MEEDICNMRRGKEKKKMREIHKMNNAKGERKNAFAIWITVKKIEMGKEIGIWIIVRKVMEGRIRNMNKGREERKVRSDLLSKQR